MPTARGDRSTRDFKRRGDQTVRSRGPRSKRWGFVELGIAVGDRALLATRGGDEPPVRSPEAAARRGAGHRRRRGP